MSRSPQKPSSPVYDVRGYDNVEEPTSPTLKSQQSGINNSSNLANMLLNAPINMNMDDVVELPDSLHSFDLEELTTSHCVEYIMHLLVVDEKYKKTYSKILRDLDCNGKFLALCYGNVGSGEEELDDMFINAGIKHDSHRALLVQGASKLVSEFSYPHSPIRFIDFDHFKKVGAFPRYPNSRNLATPLQTIRDSYNRGRQYSNKENKDDQVFFVFISHKWFKGSSGQPDDEKSTAYRLCVQGIEKLWRCYAPHKRKCFVWLDYSCLYQDGGKASVKLGRLERIMELCDCVFTPIVDPPSHSTSSSLPTPAFASTPIDLIYASKGWSGDNTHSYLSSAWCRTELLYGAYVSKRHILDNVKSGNGEQYRGGRDDDVEAATRDMWGGDWRKNDDEIDEEERQERPHFLYGTNEVDTDTPPTLIKLPPLSSLLVSLHPSSGVVSNKKDWPIIDRLVQALEEDRSSHDSMKILTVSPPRKDRVRPSHPRISIKFCTPSPQSGHHLNRRIDKSNNVTPYISHIVLGTACCFVLFFSFSKHGRSHCRCKCDAYDVITY